MRIKRALWEAQGGVCFYCAAPWPERLFWRMTRDHLWPRCAGHGCAMNIVLACAQCNVDKGNRLPTADEVAKALGVWARTIEILRRHHKILPTGWRPNLLRRLVG